MQTVHRLRYFTISALATVLAATPVWAEVFNIRVSYYDTYDNAIQRKAGIEANLKHLAEGMYEATNGAHTLGKVTIYTDAAYNDNATVVWVASCWPNANINGFGSAGQRIEHCDTFPNGGSPINFVEKQRSGGFTLMHEWGHFTYALYDEYVNSDTACGQDPGSPCKDDVGVQNAVMNSHWGAIGEEDAIGDLNWLNFSTAVNNAANTNAQSRIYSASSWDVLVRPDSQDPKPGQRKQYEDLVNVKPADGQAPSLELNNPDELAKAIANLQIEWVAGTNASDARAGARAAGVTNQASVARVLVIDNSASVSAAMLAEVKAAAAQLVDNADEGEQIVVVALDSASLLVVPLTTLNDEATKDSVIQAIEGITAGNSQIIPAARLSDALQAGLINYIPQLDAVTSSLYVFANGLTAKDMLTPAQVKSMSDAADMLLYVFDLGTDDAAGGILRKLAEQTEGMYLSADTAEKLQTALEQVDLEASPAVDAVLADGMATVNGTQEFPFEVDASLSEVEVSVQYTGAPSGISFGLVDPQGTNTPFAAEACGDVVKEAVDGVQENFCFTQLNQAAVGTWKLLATTASGSANVEYYVTGIPSDNGSAIFSNVTTAKQTDGSLLITASVSGDEMTVTGIQASATVTQPNGAKIDVSLRDDGVAPDSRAQDGLYTGSLANAEDGSYKVVVAFNNAAGTGQLTDKSSAFAPSTQGKLPAPTVKPMTSNFTRVAQNQTVVLSPYKRVMNWAEATFPDLLPMRGKQELDIAPFKVRYYPGNNTYLGYNTADGMIYIYNPQLFGPDIVPVGKADTFMNMTKQAGF